MLLNIRAALFYMGYAAITVVWGSLGALVGWALPYRARFLFIVGCWTRFSLGWLRMTCGIRHEVQGLEHLRGKPCIVLSRHESTWETLFLQTVFAPQATLIKRELLWIPFFGWAFRTLQPIAIDRSDGATDPDREGESISWHLMEAAQIDPDRAKRVVFHEITAPPVAEAFSHPRHINMDLVNAQQARRVLDRLVGYSIRPILWEKVRGRLSAGRVQSVALRLIVEREREIEHFKPVEYWSIHAELKHGSARSSFLTKLVRIDDKEPDLPNESAVKPVLMDMETAAYTVSKIKRGERKRKPSGPFTPKRLN